MRPSIRLQLVVSIAVLCVLALVPLYVAVARLTTATLRGERQAFARAMGRSVAAHVAEASSRRSAADLKVLMDAQIGGDAGVYALGVYHRSGERRLVSPSTYAGPELPSNLRTPRREKVWAVRSAIGDALAVSVPSREGTVVVLLRTDRKLGRGSSLVKLVGLYGSLFGLGLVVFAYFSLGRLIVRPVDSLARAAAKVAQGARQYHPQPASSAELYELGQSLAQMTDTLRRDEETLRERLSELERVMSELKSAQSSLIRSERLASVGRLSAGLAHEVGNPLAALMGLQDLLLDEVALEPDERKDFLQRMRRETERIHKIVLDLLAFARPARALEGPPDAPASEGVPGNVAQAAEEVASLVQPQKSMRDRSLTLEVESGLPAVRLAPGHLVQVMLNFVLNAADATGPGGEITLGARKTDEGVMFFVEDNGHGISPEVADALFEPFVTTKEVGQGTGLGLAVCQGLVEEAGGEVSAGPRDDGHQGARFSVNLPRWGPRESS